VKNIFALLMLMISVNSYARVSFERVVPCNSHSVRTSGQIELKGESLESYIWACSLAGAGEIGKRVCESDSFSYLRPNRGAAMKFAKSTISPTTCNSRELDFKCETRVVVECE
jgi:hypothetical protein